ncbi:hypothetical protein GUITHDRAFT_154630 [Guillardia theta CCMP2712]|uniref:Uncharacterized protein n=1 Tax=Guillardia theta (strain CCMP2712) TaxID=905079 RepID=L1ISL4_GUITC|nr:hypothetical protein GUITHDRAFT_154630 [Guillardia theta CCMP2712]EKX38800.1 hypothetical protein GUITHDRAFT_154630 [Guillardia theta CCMP2712]|eukprot:XP_005825780.1 hypothetical protein GUITHDRAFT_154630 [Guillardia theta CCMP2712]
MERKAATAVAGIIGFGIVSIFFLVSSTTLRAERPYYLMMKPARTQELWFGPGIADDLNRMVRIGQDMSPKLSEYIKKGLEAQARMVHLDDMHQDEISHANDEADAWTKNGGNNNGGNEPCMLPPGECP